VVAAAVRFSTLDAMCRVLECQSGDLLEWVDEVDEVDQVDDEWGDPGDS
jgi:putative transcriptional regulator